MRSNTIIMDALISKAQTIYETIDLREDDRNFFMRNKYLEWHDEAARTSSIMLKKRSYCGNIIAMVNTVTIGLLPMEVEVNVKKKEKSSRRK